MFPKKKKKNMLKIIKKILKKKPSKMKCTEPVGRTALKKTTGTQGTPSPILTEI